LNNTLVEFIYLKLYKRLGNNHPPNERRKTMKKTLLNPVTIFILLVSFASVTIAQMSAKGWDKTVTLQSGEVILDMNGEWDDMSEGYGIFDWWKGSPEILTITQEGNLFTAIKQIGSVWVPKGAETIKGELDKDGFKVVYSYISSRAQDMNFDWEECKWKISEKGNRVDLDCGGRIKRALTRK
jgi:hypothetical protein